MASWICKILRFLLNVADAVIETVTSLVELLVDGVSEIAGAIVDGAGSVFGKVLSSPVLLIGGGLLLWFLISGEDKAEEATLKTVNRADSNLAGIGGGAL